MAIQETAMKTQRARDITFDVKKDAVVIEGISKFFTKPRPLFRWPRQKKEQEEKREIKALEGIQLTIKQSEIWNDTWPLLITGVISIPVGIFIFRQAERYAKRTGKLKRNG